MRFAKHVEQRLYNLDIPALIPCADVVNRAGAPVLGSSQNRATVILDENPVTHILPVAVYRNRLVVHRISKREWQKLFRKLPWSVVVSAACNNSIQTKRVMRGSYEMLRRGFRRCVRA